MNAIMREMAQSGAVLWCDEVRALWSRWGDASWQSVEESLVEECITQHVLECPVCTTYRVAYRMER